MAGQTMEKIDICGRVFLTSPEETFKIHPSEVAMQYVVWRAVHSVLLLVWTGSWATLLPRSPSYSSISFQPHSLSVLCASS